MQNKTLNQEQIVKILRQHAEFLRLLEDFPVSIRELPRWIERKDAILEKYNQEITSPHHRVIS
ncbi:MAG: hypothetical protein H7A25_02470 [Leptospiraceae bacterium]|nr:hypothetical protein [Leptospiraceae bacterium]MCP5498742.1 hypothetical protein [Leptospiraceae bacterium]